MCADTGTVPEQGDAQELPFEDRSFDAATMGYGLRNVADKPRALTELRRVLRPGCRAAILVGGVLTWQWRSAAVSLSSHRGLRDTVLQPPQDFNNARANPAVDAFQVSELRGALGWCCSECCSAGTADGTAVRGRARCAGLVLGQCGGAGGALEGRGPRV